MPDTMTTQAPEGQEPLPCPFCDHVGLNFSEGSTFRWISYSCGGCGIGNETRVKTMGEGTRDEWRAQAERDAIAEWNNRPHAPSPAGTDSALRVALAERLIDAALDSDASGRPDGALAQLALQLRAALAAPPAAPEQPSEPVASVHRDTLAMLPTLTAFDGGAKLWPARKAAIDSAYVPLYATPTSAPPAAQAVPTFAIGQRVRKRSGSEWQGRVVGRYSTTLTPDGYAVESEAHAGSVQIYPAAALTAPDPVLPEVPETEAVSRIVAWLRGLSAIAPTAGYFTNGTFHSDCAQAANLLAAQSATPPPAAQASAETVRGLPQDEEAWYRAVRKAEHMCPTDLPHLDKQRWKARHIQAALTAALAQKETR